MATVSSPAGFMFASLRWYFPKCVLDIDTPARLDRFGDPVHQRPGDEDTDGQDLDVGEMGKPDEGIQPEHDLTDEQTDHREKTNDRHDR